MKDYCHCFQCNNGIELIYQDTGNPVVRTVSELEKCCYITIYMRQCGYDWDYDTFHDLLLKQQMKEWKQNETGET